MSKENPTFGETVLLAGGTAARIALYTGATLGGAAIAGASTAVVLGVGVPTVVGGVWVAKKFGFFRKK